MQKSPQIVLLHPWCELWAHIVLRVEILEYFASFEFIFQILREEENEVGYIDIRMTRFLKECEIYRYDF